MVKVFKIKLMRQMKGFFKDISDVLNTNDLILITQDYIHLSIQRLNSETLSRLTIKSSLFSPVNLSFRRFVE